MSGKPLTGRQAKLLEALVATQAECPSWALWNSQEVLFKHSKHEIANKNGKPMYTLDEILDQLPDEVATGRQWGGVIASLKRTGRLQSSKFLVVGLGRLDFFGL